MRIDLEALYIAIAKSKNTQRSIAEKAGLDKSHLSKIMNGITTPTAKTVMKISEALEIPIETIIKEMK